MTAPPPRTQPFSFRLFVSLAAASIIAAPLLQTSEAAVDTVAAEPNGVSITRNGADMTVHFDAVQALTYRLERKLQLTAPAWESIPGVSDYVAPATGPAQITDPGALSLGRAFYRVSYLPRLNVDKAGTGAGTVTSAPAGIDCGTDCTEAFLHGTLASLAATPASGSAFSSWSGVCAGGSPTCDVTMDAERSVSASFTLLNSNPVCSGNVFLGSLSGDTGSGGLSVTGVGERWYRARITENNNANVYLSATVSLSSPAGADYDLVVYCVGCGGTTAGSSTTTGTDTVNVRREDRPFGNDDSYDILIEIRYFSGNSPAQWSLTVAGNVAVTTATCP